MNFKKLDEIFRPDSVAIVGASGNQLSPGHAYTKFIIEHFDGEIYPVNPKIDELFDMKVYPSLRDIPGSVDYVISCISAEKTPELVDDCQAKNVELLHLFTAKMSETGREAKIKLEQKILEKVQQTDIRLLGPNCMGCYRPDVGLAYGYNFPKETGEVGVIFQSGGSSTNLVRYGAMRGLRFSKVFSYGNGIDIDESELLRYLADDPETEIIALYVEGVDDGQKFRNALEYASKKMPVVVLKGGKSEAGARSIRSHTASLAGEVKVWRGIFEQCGAIEVSSIQELIDQLVAFRFVKPFAGDKALIAGGGGGKSVISADIWGEQGFKLPDLPSEMRDELKSRKPEIWDWLGNPVDFSIIQDSDILPHELLEMFDKSGDIDFFVLNLALGDYLTTDIWKRWTKRQINGFLNIKDYGKPCLVIAETVGTPPSKMEEWRWKAIEEIRGWLRDEGVAVFPSPERAARVIRRLKEYYERKTNNGGQT